MLSPGKHILHVAYRSAISSIVTLNAIIYVCCCSVKIMSMLNIRCNNKIDKYHFNLE